MTAEGSPERISFAEFLATVPPGRVKRVSSGAGRSRAFTNHFELATPDTTLHCPECGGTRTFHCTSEQHATFSERPAYAYLHYGCRNCRKADKTFAVCIIVVDPNVSRDRFEVDVAKLGEIPPFGPPLPSKLVTMIRKDRELFAKGRRAEDQGLGIGAFTYYRRVVENQKDQLLDEIRKVVERENRDPELLEQIEAAKHEQRFASAVEKIKAAIPASIQVQGQNPLALLHNVLSAHVHGESDEKCLELATAVRTVLTEFAERLSEALKDDQTLKDAVKTLTDYAQAKKPSA